MISKQASLFSQLTVVLVNTRNPLNIGAVARAMSNFGFSDLRLVQPYEASFREARSALGGAPVLRDAREYADVASAVADCTLVIGTTAAQSRALQHALRRLDVGTRLIQKQLQVGKAALLFGSEKRGLSNDDLSHCHWLLRIPTREEHGSMNLGQAVAVCLYELARAEAKQASPSSGPAIHTTTDKNTPANQEILERLTDSLIDCLFSSGYLEGKTSAVSVTKIRRTVLRMGLSAEDAEVWLGMVRQILWKLRQAK